MSRIVSAAYTQTEQIFASSEGMLSPKMFTFDPTYITADDDNTKVIHPGLFGAKMANGKARLLPRAKLGSVTISSTAIVLNSVELAKTFVVGDVLHALPPYQTLTFALTWADADTATVTLNGVSYTYPVTGYSSLSGLATAFAAYLNADSQFSAIATAIANAAVVYVYANDMKTLYAISVSSNTAGDGTLTAGASALAVNNTAIGTITTAGVDVTDKTLTLASTAAVTGLPIGMPIGVRSGYEIVGVIGKPHDFTATRVHPGDGSYELGVFDAASVYEDRLPYLDGEIKAKFPQLILV